MKKFFIPIIFICMIIAGCSNTYTHLSAEEAAKFMKRNPDAIILDVRTEDEYSRHHIPNSLLVPIETLRAGDFSALPDKNKIIMVYCWTGRRAEDASAILIENGYTNIYEFGGLIDWRGEVEGIDIDNR